MAASMWSEAYRCTGKLHTNVLRCTRGTTHLERDILLSRVLTSCSLCTSVSDASCRMRLRCPTSASAASRRLLNLMSMTHRRAACFGFTTFSTASCLETALFSRAFLHPNAFWCRTICSSFVVCQKSDDSTLGSKDTSRDSCAHVSGSEQGRLGQNLEEPELHEHTQNRTKAKKDRKENIKTIPNMLTAMRMASAPLLGYLVVCESFYWALGIFVCAGVTDLLDGFIARNFANQTSVLGTVIDPLADKLLVSVLTVSLTCVGLIPLPLTLLIVSRDLALIAGGFYIRYKSLHPPITLSRYFDISHATAKLSPTTISKVNTVFQLTLVAASLAAPVFGFVNHILLQALWCTTGATTFASGVDYMWSWKKYVTLLEKDQKDL